MKPRRKHLLNNLTDWIKFYMFKTVECCKCVVPQQKDSNFIFHVRSSVAWLWGHKLARHSTAGIGRHAWHDRGHYQHCLYPALCSKTFPRCLLKFEEIHQAMPGVKIYSWQKEREVWKWFRACLKMSLTGMLLVYTMFIIWYKVVRDDTTSFFG